MSLSIRRLRTLIAIAEKGTFTAAADVMAVSHAAVSQQMKMLEDELGVSLFDRDKRSPELNQLGHAIVGRAREIVRSYDTMVESATGADGLMGELTIGALPTTLTGLVPQTIGALKARYPDLRIRVTPGLSAELLPQVERGGLDAAIVSAPLLHHSHVNWQPFVEEPLVVIAAEDEVLADPRALLEQRPYIRFNRKAWVGQVIDEWLRAERLAVNETMELDTLEAIASMVHSGLGVSVVPRACVPPPNPLPLKQVLLGDAAPTRTLGVVSRRDSVKFQLIEAIGAELSRIANM